MCIPDSDVDAVVRWATNSRYPSRVHMTNGRGRVSLCGFPVDSASRQRPDGLGVCPDCATVFVDLSFPLNTRAGSDRPRSEWFRRLPSPERRPLLRSEPVAPGTDAFLRHLHDLSELLIRPWQAHILTALSTKAMRYGELLAAVRVLACTRNTGELPGSMFDQTLTVMHHAGLVTRHEATPSTATYELTLTAVELQYALRPALLWITAHPETIEPTTPRARFRTSSIATKGNP